MIEVDEDPLFRRIRAHADQRIGSDLAPDRESLVKACGKFFRLEREMLLRYHRKGDSGLRVARAGSIVIDVLLEKLFSAALEQAIKELGEAPTPIALMALGGYGRKEMAPYSDIDLMILLPNRRERAQDRAFYQSVTENLLYPLWDLGLKVGHSTRTVRQAMDEAAAELQSRNAFFEARFLNGSRSLYQSFEKAFQNLATRRDISADIELQSQQRAERHSKFGNTPFVQTPDIKQGVGGLRDYQGALWLARQRFGIRSTPDLVRKNLLTATEARNFVEAYDFLYRVRNELHFFSKRPIETLDLERQPVVAWGLGYKQRDIFKRVELFMRDYYSRVRVIHRISRFLEDHFRHRDLPTSRDRFSFGAVIEAHRSTHGRTVDGFIIRNGIMDPCSSQVFEEDPDRMIRVFRHLQQYQTTLSLGLERLIEASAAEIIPTIIQSEAANRSFRAILQTAGAVHPILEKMHELGVLGRFIPEFGKLTCLVQHEYYHRYTADVHVLNTIAELDRIFQAKDQDTRFYRKVIRDCDNPTLVYLALLLHDIGKSEGVAGHDKRGAAMSKAILTRLGVEHPFAGQIYFLVANHLEMARFWQRFDIDDPETIESFAKFVQEAERLRFLFVLTFCDSRGTSADLWSGYKQLLHERLFRATHRQLTDEKSVTRQRMERKNNLQREILERASGGISREEIDAHFHLLPERYFIYHSVEEIELHLRMVHELLAQITTAESVNSLLPAVDWVDDTDLGLTVVDVVTWDRAGLFSKLAGAFSVAGLNILSAKAISRGDHIAIDTFYVVEPGGSVVQDQNALKAFQKHVEAALTEDVDLMDQIRKQAEKSVSRYFRPDRNRLQATIEPTINVYHELSLKRTIIEVEANDSIGLLYGLSRTISKHGFDITFARISTENGVANDTFYVEKSAAPRTAEATDIVDLKTALLETIAEGHQAEKLVTGRVE